MGVLIHSYIELEACNFIIPLQRTGMCANISNVYRLKASMSDQDVKNKARYPEGTVIASITDSIS